MKLKELRLNYAQQLIELEKGTSNELNELDNQDDEIKTENEAQYETEQNQIENKEMCSNELFESLLQKPNGPDGNAENLNDEQFDDFSSFPLIPPVTSRLEPPEIIVQQNSSEEQLDEELNVSPSSSSFVLHQSFLSNCECDSKCTPFANPISSNSAENTDEIKTEIETSLAQMQPNKPLEIRSKSAVELSTQTYEEDILDVDSTMKQSGNKTASTNQEVQALANKEKPSDFRNLFSNRMLRTKSKYNRSITDLSSSSSSTNTTVNSFNNRFLFYICFEIRSQQ